MDALQDEVESLEAILMDDVRIIRNKQSDAVEAIETTVLPLSGEEEDQQQLQQYICVTLQVLPTPGYPDESPEFKLLRPRGLDDARLEAIRSACAEKITQSLGFPVVFDLIEVVREHLTGSNLPSGQCVICLYGFSDGDEFTRTECFHYLHSYCLARHLNALRRNYQEEYNKLPAWLQRTSNSFQAACPVCREPIKDETDSLKCAMPPSELQNAPEFKVTQELREMQLRMSTLYLQQKSRGAIIDIEAESAPVISIETEEDIRRRLKREEAADAARRAATLNSTMATTATMSLSLTPSGSSSTNNHATSHVSTFAPVPQQQHQQQTQQQRILPEPTNHHNNNYTYNRRHYRGGRRHNHHHHHHNRGERGADGRDSNNGSTSHNNGSSNGANGGNGGSAAPTTSAVSVGKQPKAQTAGGAHAR